MAEIPCPVSDAAHEAPDALALCTAARQWTYREWNRRIAAMMERLRGLGVTPGHRVAILATTGEPYLTLLLALWRLAAVACPLNVRWPRERLASLIECSDNASLSPAALRVQHVIVDGTVAANLPWPCLSLDALDDASPVETHDVPTLDTGRHATIYFTSGSSGTPKAVLHRLENHYANACASNRNIPLLPGDCWLLSLPLYHVAGMGILWRCITARAAIALPDEGEEITEAMERHRVTHVSLVTTQLYRLAQAAESVDALRRLKAILLGGSAVAPSLIDRAIGLKLPLYKTYGLTEAASQVATTRPADPTSALFTSGTPIIDGSVRIGDDGRILIRGETRFEAYVRGDELECPFDRDSWFDTGDRGEWTEDGYLRVIGRADTMFISGGENVQPEEIERALCRIDGVDEAIVVPVPDDEFGHRGVALVRTNRRAAEITAELRAVLPGYMIPRSILPWPAHLVEANAKIARVRLQDYARSLMAQADREPTAPHPE